MQGGNEHLMTLSKGLASGGKKGMTTRRMRSEGCIRARRGAEHPSGCVNQPSPSWLPAFARISLQRTNTLATTTNMRPDPSRPQVTLAPQRARHTPAPPSFNIQPYQCLSIHFVQARKACLCPPTPPRTCSSSFKIVALDPAMPVLSADSCSKLAAGAVMVTANTSSSTDVTPPPAASTAIGSPGRARLQEGALAWLVVPVGHTLQYREPGLSAKVPMMQLRHCTVPHCEVKVPAGHGEQAELRGVSA